jgi:hypothetical protein
MAMASLLEAALESEHRRIKALAEEARTVVPEADEPRIRYRLTDTFSTVLSRHLAAIDDVLLPEAKRATPDGHQRIREYVHDARQLEATLHRLKGRLYGDGTANIDWDSLWSELEAELAEHATHEDQLVHELSASLTDQEAQHLIDRLMDAEEHAPTRPHPYTPHTGILGRLAHRFWRIADGFWDQAEGRLIPHREEKPPARPDSLMHRYFTGAPPHQPED